MKIKLAVYFMFVLLLALAMPMEASNCTPFTKAAQPNLLAIGTKVEFHYPIGSNAVLTGVIEEYYVSAICPEGAIINADPSTYVVWYGDTGPYHNRLILNQKDLTVKTESRGALTTR